MNWGQPAIGSRCSLRNLSAGLLLLLMLGDLALHIGEALTPSPNDGLTSATEIHAGLVVPHADESDCPIPGHSSSLFHHHHFPGVIPSACFVFPVQSVRAPAIFMLETTGLQSLYIHPGRAPPLS